jgi:hypothetical protein
MTHHLHPLLRRLSMVSALLLAQGVVMATQVPSLNVQFSSTSATTEGDRLTVSTGRATRTWQWTGQGLATVSWHRTGGREWCGKTPSLCDWQLPGNLPMAGARLVALTAHEDTDEGFTTPHLRIMAEIEYPAARLAVRYLVWAYPNAPGFRTQQLVRARSGYEAVHDPRQGNGIDRTNWRIVEATGGTGGATALLDGSTKTTWTVPHPEGKDSESTLVLDLGQDYSLTGFGLRQEQDYRRKWAVERVLVSHSQDGDVWSAESTGTFSRATYLQSCSHAPRTARFVRFRIPATDLPYTGDFGTAIAELFLYDEAHPAPVLPAYRTESLSLDLTSGILGTVEYFSETQFRNRDGLPLAVEDTHPLLSATFPHANLLWGETGGEGFCIVKESHKTANHHGHRTGDFRWQDGQLACTGWGIAPNEIDGDWCRAWATWSVLYSGGADERQQAVKTFDALRYPVRPEMDGVVMANTWGGGTSSEHSRELAWEGRVLEELEAVHDLGIDFYQIDDGWQVESLRTSNPDGGRGWKPHPKVYPDDWQRVRERADQLGIRLGLWTAVQSIPLSDLVWNQERGAFLNWKMDFANLPNYRSREQLEDKVRTFIRQFDHRVNVSWDLTEISPRYGYFWAREYGSVWLENRKKRMRPWILYTPHLTLRDAWELASYANIRKFQLPIVNVAEVDPPSDASAHPQAYAVAIAMVGIPLFFEQPSVFAGEAKRQVVETIRLFKSCREDMLSQLVYPIGAPPSNASCTGFQTHSAGQNHGYLILFRERNATATEGSFALRFVHDRKLRVEDLRSGQSKTVDVDAEGTLVWTIDQPADFALLRYSW